MTGFIEREMLIAPDPIARAAARLASGPQQRWMLGQPLAVRRSYLREVLDRGGDELTQRVWMLRQADPVRLGYLEQVGVPDPSAAWMLRQAQDVRASYVAEVLLR